MCLIMTIKYMKVVWTKYRTKRDSCPQTVSAMKVLLNDTVPKNKWGMFAKKKLQTAFQVRQKSKIVKHFSTIKLSHEYT